MGHRHVEGFWRSTRLESAGGRFRIAAVGSGTIPVVANPV